MNWARIYLFNAAMSLVMGIYTLADWHREGGRYSLVAGAAMVLLSPSWLIHWSRARRDTGSKVPNRP